MRPSALSQPSRRIRVLNDIAQQGLDILTGPGHELGPTVEDPEAILVRSTKINPDDYPSLHAIARAGAGVDNIDVARATARGIPVFFAPGENAQSVNELVFIALGMYVRNIADTVRLRDRIINWDEDPYRQARKSASALKTLLDIEKRKRVGTELFGKRLGVIGLGYIGRLVANGGIRRGMRVTGYDPAVQELDDRYDQGIELGTMAQVLRNSDIISIHVPYIKDMKPLIGASEIEMMRHGSVLINYARGELVDESALLEGLEKKPDQEAKLAAYLTDFPTLDTVTHPKVQWTEHLGASTGESETRCAIAAAQALKDYLAFGVIRNAVNFPDMLQHPRAGFPMRLAIPHRNVPGQLKVIIDVVTAAGANIGPQHNDVKNGIGYCVVDLEQPLDDAQVAAIKNGHENIIAVHAFRY